jgi:hypothetical protein
LHFAGSPASLQHDQFIYQTLDDLFKKLRKDKYLINLGLHEFTKNFRCEIRESKPENHRYGSVGSVLSADIYFPPYSYN